MGDNDRGQRYDSIELIFRDESQIERFMNNHQNPPVISKREKTFDEIQANLRGGNTYEQ